MIKNSVLLLLILILLGAYGEAKEEREVPGMKCGAGKCGANMFDGNAALAKKKRNMLSQMREDDPRKDCVIRAASTKAAYDCVRDPNGKKLILKCGSGKCGTGKDRDKMPAMKCGAGKCGSSMEVIKLKKKPEAVPQMKCGAGKCGSGMKEIKPKKAPMMKCGAGKCGSSM